MDLTKVEWCYWCVYNDSKKYSMAIANLVCGRDGRDIAGKGTCEHYLEREDIRLIKAKKRKVK